jgi:hypothetical protein
MIRNFIFAAIVLCVALAGCSQQAGLIVYNRTGAPMVIVDADDNPRHLKDGDRFETAFFGAGVRFYATVGGERLEYIATHYPPREFRGTQYPYDVVVAFKADQSIYACLPDGTEIATQPDGFPIRPNKR